MIAIARLVLFLLFAAQAFGQQDSELFDESVVHDIRLAVDPAAWQTLRDNYLSNDYYRADFQWKGALMPEVGIRSRGSGSRSPEKPNLLVRFDRYRSGQRFLGLRDITLKANNQDASIMTENVALSFLRRMGMSAPRASYARLWINDEFFGLYTIVEPINRDFLGRVFENSQGYLYEYNPEREYHFEYLGEDPAAYSFFEPQTRENDPQPATLIDMIRTVNQAPQGDFAAQVSSYIDLKRFMRLIAIENYLANNDGILSAVFGMNNFYLYREPDSTVFEFLPWDADLTFGGTQVSLLAGIGGNVLARRAFEAPELRLAYLDTLAESAALAGAEGGWLEQEFRRYYALIAQDARNDPHKQCLTDNGIQPCGASDFEQRAAGLFLFAAERTPFVLANVALLRCAARMDFRPRRGLEPHEAMLQTIRGCS
jgi:hypothetical protein